MAFGPDRRLRAHAEFVRAQNGRTTRRVVTGHFTLLVAAQRVPGPARLGLVVGKRVGGAVARNRVKRLCRECFRSSPSLVPRGVDLIAIARPGAPELGLAEVRAEWLGASRTLIKRAREALDRSPAEHHPAADPARAGMRADRNADTNAAKNARDADKD